MEISSIDHNIKYVPSQCKGDDATFKGCVVLKTPSIEERMEFMIKMADYDNPTEDEPTIKRQAALIKKSLEMMKMSYQYYVKIDLKRIKDDKKFKTLDEMRYDPDCQRILQEISGKIVEGFHLGNE